MSYLSPGYLVLSQTKLDNSFPSAQFSVTDYEIRATILAKIFETNCSFSVK